MVKDFADAFHADAKLFDSRVIKDESGCTMTDGYCNRIDGR